MRRHPRLRAVLLACLLLVSAVVGLSAAQGRRSLLPGSAPVAGPSSLQGWELGPAGVSWIEVTGACARVFTPVHAGSTCAASRAGHGSFYVDAPIRVRLVATWKPACGSCDVLIVGAAGVTHQGRSPLVVDVGGVERGEYDVEVEFARLVVGQVHQDVAWTVEYA